MSKKKRKQKQNKRRKKIRLPVDRNGTPINLGDWLMFDEGPLQVKSLTFYEGSNGIEWIGGNDNDDYASDNLSGGVILKV